MQHSQPETHLGTHLTCEHLSTDKPLEELAARHTGAHPLHRLPRGTATTLLNDGRQVMTSIAEAAQTAAVFIEHSAAASEFGPYRGADLARTAVRLASTLSLTLDHITISPDWLRRRTTPGEPLLATATCPATGTRYEFLARQPLHEDDPFELLGPCPTCKARVPLADIRHLADLGTFLATGPTPLDGGPIPPTYPTTFADDEAHTPTCPYGPTP
ncbi:hypothetical protein SBI_08552 [Streptomyces bingchenggensis BCW-1]|uniref:Uncharacterized protein n=1 Tax=Streptomyces bingchenggensis (strain BCW-1) TaxID=749414 RepID=D7BUC1_STRBB|nr:MULTISPECIES: hypothetical protein [Streptomyces]ADI11670.1 hypothetical protein SBI_08552 [Streptomyces bingchenggensis BCW-1]